MYDFSVPVIRKPLLPRESLRTIKAKKGMFGKGVSSSFFYKHIGDTPGTSVAAVRRAISKTVAAARLEIFYSGAHACFMFTLINIFAYPPCTLPT